ncbi:complex I subunit 4 family protein [Flectobacillus rivi]|uniref:NADH-quinone oxidoreductase subunit M n=1 Tax=Flectobacillus rivi TaxID=2984209 RepID=A0ABT6Z2U3_9BACT|nr:NADH-quinone oxidoreductase subunit M [Flectobacillus rivi]MDI9875428.1 NADH-quinone oxidoreductase subunit M [Flectobacillus rivi]
MSVLSLLIFLPIAFSVVILLLPENLKGYFKWITVGVTAVEFLLSIWVYLQFDQHTEGFQFLVQKDWITLPLGSLGVASIDYLIGVDGISMPMILLTGLVMFIGSISSFEIGQKEKAYYALYLLLTGSVIGCFVALDMFLFYLFFEFMLLPMYFLIGIWGGPRKEYASIKFFIYTLVGSLFILVVMIGLYLSAIDPVETALQTGLISELEQVTPNLISEIQRLLAEGRLPSEQLVHTFDLRFLPDPNNFLPESWLHVFSNISIAGMGLRSWAFIFLLIGFGIKLPAVPVHTWLPDAHVEAPTPVSVVLAGILLKIGGYGLLRIAYPIFPEAGSELAFVIAIVGVVSILYGAYNALAMNDLKKLIAYSSVSHMGFVLLGIASLTSEGINGAVFQMFSHGILSAMLFVLVGVLYSRTHDRRINSYQGLASKMPVYTALTAVAFFASLGLPAFSGFIGEFFTLIGGFNSLYFPKWVTGLGVLGLVLGAGYFLWTLQRMFFGKFWSRYEESVLSDLNTREKLMLFPLAILALIFGIFPNLVFDVSNQAVNELIKLFV